MKPTTRNGLIALILLVLGIDAAAVIARIDDDGPRTQVSSAPPTSAPPTTSAPTTTTATTTTTPTTYLPPAAVPAGVPATTTVPTTSPPAVGVPAAQAPTTTRGATTATTVPPPTGAAQTPTGATHPNTGGPSSLLPALVFIGTGLAGLRLRARSRLTPSSHTNKEDPKWPPTS